MPERSDEKAGLPSRPDIALAKPAPRAGEVSPKLAPTASEAGASEGGCDRCGAEMFRMHAVWRCPRCGFKTDCCGW
jgi:hypothetical protein